MKSDKIISAIILAAVIFFVGVCSFKHGVACGRSAEKQSRNEPR